MNKSKALAAYLNVKPSEVSVSEYDDNIFSTPNSDEYLVLTRSESESRVWDEIRDSVWAFVPDFIIDHSTPCQSNRSVFSDMIRIVQEKLCESANNMILRLIDDFDEFVDDAIRVDGIGHFLARYDDREIDLGDGLYAYRIN